MDLSTKFASSNDTLETLKSCPVHTSSAASKTETSSEDTQTRNSRCSSGGEKVVGPRHQVLHSAVTGNHGRLRSGKKLQALVETFSERRRAHGP